VQDLQAVGIKATIQNIPDATTRVGQMTDGKAGPMYWNDWGYYSVFDADGLLWDMFHSSSPYSYFRSPDLDKLIEEGRTTIDAPKETRDLFRREMGLDQPLAVQYARFASGALRGDFGESFVMKKSALSLVLERLPATVQLALAGLAFALCVAVPLGTLAAYRR